MGPKKTIERINYSFFWEGLRADVRKFCESCKECQLTRSVRIKDRSPITPVARPELPFQVVNMDLIGPIDPPSSRDINIFYVWLISTLGYPQSNGLVERFNRTLKNMLHNVVRDEGRGWHLQIPYVLWAYREIPHSTTGVSPFQLLYGRQPQSPLSILKSTWTGKHNNLQLCTTPVSKYLEDLKCKLEKVAEQAKLVSTVQQEKDGLLP
ncbi:retrovirus-related Pol polyprotein from transposon opus [Trichonephila clavipes]|nr:retrovirus-related Pol polyprotein from transposon opus [Trichonephila clavipes]